MKIANGIFLSAFLLVPTTLLSACGEDGDDADTSTMSGASGESDGSDSGGAISCEDACPAVLDAACAAGPADLADCMSGCAYSQMTCPTESTALFECLGPSPTFTCDDMGRVSSDACVSEYAALYACLGV